jgi:hypothetical protein
LLIGILIARLLKGRKKWFYLAHKAFETSSVILVFIAVIITGINLTVGFHAYFGLITFFGLSIILVLGIYYDRIKPTTDAAIIKKKNIRKIHIIIGVLFLITTLFGLINILNYL